MVQECIEKANPRLLVFGKKFKSPITVGNGLGRKIQLDMDWQSLKIESNQRIESAGNSNSVNVNLKYSLIINVETNPVSEPDIGKSALEESLNQGKLEFHHLFAQLLIVESQV